ncbi:hypothetical protein FWF74_03290 [Candidatus Saccharibacteria bacterium]|nr:hypothetical protein [Candidatus Saccharibacteria bacterium]MCL1962799.1 hypothetical protein [Candidatus Saccharibacteria bacterium]
MDAERKEVESGGLSRGDSGVGGADKGRMRDLARPEHDNTNTPGFQYNNTAGKGKSKSKGGFFGKHKKGITGWIIGLVMGGGIFTMGTIISGPVQFLQILHFVKDVKMWVSDAQTSVRMMKSMKSTAMGIKDSIASNIQSTRLGIIGNRMADSAIKNMANNGLVFNSNIAGNAQSIIVDLNEVGMDKLDSLLKIGDSLESISNIGEAMFDLSKMSYTQARRFINEMNDVGRFDIIGRIKTRMALKKVNKISWLHPFKKLKKWATDKLLGFLGKRLAKLLGKNADEMAETFTKGGFKAVAKTVMQSVLGMSEATAEAVLEAFTIIGIILVIIQVFCFLNGIDKHIGAMKYAGTVATAIGDLAETVGVGSQIMSGSEDLDMEEIGEVSKLKLYSDEVYVGRMEGDESGNLKTVATDERISSSFWDAAPVRAALGEPYGDKQIATVPVALNDVNNGYMSFGGNNWIGAIVRAIIDGVGAGLLGPIGAVPGVSEFVWDKMICKVNDWINDQIGKGVSWVLGKFWEHVLKPFIGMLVPDFQKYTDYVGKFLGNIMGSAQGFIFGKTLDIHESTTPEEFGSIDMYGAHFLSNEQMISTGGRELTHLETAELIDDQRKFLAEEYAKKPFWAKLFDPTDYRSTANVIARAAHFNISDQHWTTQLGNVARFFGALPQLFGMAINKITGVSYALESGDWDYGVPLYAYSKSEMDTLAGSGATNTSDMWDMYENTNWMKNNIDKSMIKRVRQCFAMEIDKDDLSVKAIDNKSGTSWNYVDNTKPHDVPLSGASDIQLSGDVGGKNYNNCDDTSEYWLHVRTYIMDYNIMINNDCYYSKDSTKEGSCADAMGTGDIVAASSGGDGGEDEEL